jgi:sulfate adenylyltransferase subunit 1
MNEIARVKIRTAQPLNFDSYRKNRIMGSVILVDEGTNETVAAGMIV